MAGAPLRVDITPKMLRWARERAGVSREEAARWVSVQPERYVRWEQGQSHSERDKPTLGQVRTLGDRLKRPLAFFFLERPPRNEIDPDAFKDFRRIPEAERSLSRWLRYAMRHAQERRDVALSLAESGGLELPRFGLRCRIDEQPDDIARRVRKALGVTLEEQRTWKRESDAFAAWKRKLSRAGVLVFEFQRVDVSEARGFAIGSRPLPVVAVNGGDVLPARNFSLLHELAHVLLGSDPVLSDASQAEEAAEEQFCNAVAAAILVPGDALLGEPEVAKATRKQPWPDAVLGPLARRYGVSRQAMLRRLLTLGKVSQRYYWKRHEQFLEEYQDVKSRQREKNKASTGAPPSTVMSLKWNGPLFASVVLSAHASQQLTLAKTSKLLGIRSDLVTNMQMEVMRATS